MVNTGNQRNSRSKGKSPTDFKRLKAKVGKKVAKAPNETDTTFRKASLFVSDQSIKTKCADAILSQKGKSIPDLLVQFGHHAGTARNSALKGLINIVKENDTFGLRPLVHGLVHVASKALVDDEPTVRKTAFHLLNEIFSHFEKSTLVPFMPLIIAYVRSAMHSLDRDMRFDGANAVGVVASLFGPTMREYVASLLPPFVNLLSDREKSEDTGRLLEVLVSLLSTLHVIENESLERHQTEKCDPDQPNFSFRAGRRSRNSFLQRNRRLAQPFEIPCCLSVILGGAKHVTSEELENVQQSTTAIIPSMLLQDLQQKLCNLLDEVTDEEIEKYVHPRKGTLSFQEMKVLLRAIQLVYSARLAMRCHRSYPLDSCHFRTANLLVELFPTNVNRTFCLSVAQDAEDSMNSSITQTLLIIASYTNDFHASKGWIEKLLVFWLPFFENKVGKGLSTTEVHVIHEMLEVLSSMPRTASSVYRDRLYEELCKKFFHDPDVTVARSLAGRNAATLFAARHVDDAMRFGPSVLKSQVFIAFVKAIPVYLKAWSSDFEEDSYVVLDALRSCVTYGDDSVRELLRTNVFIQGYAINAVSELQSLFEDYSVNLQRKFLELIHAIEKPSQQILNVLAACCALCKNGTADVGMSIADEVVCTISSIRKTIPMTDYVTFLVVTMGVPRAGSGSSTGAEQQVFERILNSMDRRVSRGCKAMIECGSHSCLRMVKPQLLTWMEVPDTEDASTITVLRNRASLCLLSMLFVDLEKANVQVNGLTETLGLVEHCYEVSSHLFRFLAKSVKTSDRLRDQLLSPLAILMKLDNKFALKIGHLSDVLHELGDNPVKD